MRRISLDRVAWFAVCELLFFVAQASAASVPQVQICATNDPQKIKTKEASSASGRRRGAYGADRVFQPACKGRVQVQARNTIGRKDRARPRGVAQG